MAARTLFSAIDDFMLFENATIRTTFDGSVVLEGLASDFPERKSSVRTFSEPIPYVEPQDRGGINAVAAIFEQGIGAMFDVPLGEHTIMNVYESTFFGGPFSATYNITVVPEPAGLSIMICGSLALVGCTRESLSQRFEQLLSGELACVPRKIGKSGTAPRLANSAGPFRVVKEHASLRIPS